MSSENRFLHYTTISELLVQIVGYLRHIQQQLSSVEDEVDELSHRQEGLEEVVKESRMMLVGMRQCSCLTINQTCKEN